MKSYIKDNYQKVVQVSWRVFPEQVEFVKNSAKKEKKSESEILRSILQEKLEGKK